jgi:selenocysteine lyase/cysteine desulfurase
METFRSICRIIEAKFVSFLRRYDGFKLTCVIIAAVAFALLMCFIDVTGSGFSVRLLISTGWIIYVGEYWRAEYMGLVTVLACYIAFDWLDLVQAYFQKRVRSATGNVVRHKINKRLVRITHCLAFGLCVYVIVATPALHLVLPSWWKFYSAQLFLVAAGWSSVWSLAVRSPSIDHLRRLGGYTFPKVTYDVAFMGIQSSEAQEEVRRYARLRESRSSTQDLQTYIIGGNGNGKWRGHGPLFDKIATFLKVSPRDITFHETTTTAVTAAIRSLKGFFHHVIMSDLEYPSVRTMVAAQIEKIQIETVAVREALLKGEIPQDAVVAALINASRLWLESHAVNMRLLVICSHVGYETGLRIHLDDLRRGLNAHSERLILIGDGAQAVGNVHVEAEILNTTDFYATSGHKWLLGKESLGILIQNRTRLAEIGVDVGQIADRARPFSRYDSNDADDSYTYQTVAMEPRVSLNASLSEMTSLGSEAIAIHNRKMAKLFCDNLMQLSGVRVVAGPPESGMVSIQVRDAEECHASLRDRGVDSRLLNGAMLRFCFHYFMGEDEVFRAVDVLGEVLRA